MNAKKNILIGKIGKTVKFKNIHIETGGDTCLILYSSLARMNPEYNFYFIGPNELKKLSETEYDYIFPNHNVFSAFDRDESRFNMFEGTVDYFKKNNIKPDFALLFSGMVSEINVPNFLKKDEENYYSILNSFKSYAGPYIYALNELGCPFYTMSEDARYITINAKDLYNRERLCFTQINAELAPVDHVVSKTDHTVMEAKPVKCIYSGIEKIFLMGINENWRDEVDIDRKVNSTGEHVIILSNGCGTKEINRAKGGKKSRLPEYKKWVLDLFKNTEYKNTKIYGNWDDAVYEKHPQIEDKLLINLGEEIADAKYTLVYSMIPGFVTVKPYEVIIKGLLPFIHPDYDKYKLLDLPEYLYVNTPQEFLDKIRELDANPEMYKKLLNECMGLVKEDHLNGSRLNNFLFTEIGKDLGFEYEKKDGCKSIFNHFSKNVFDFEGFNKGNNPEPVKKETTKKAEPKVEQNAQQYTVDALF